MDFRHNRANERFCAFNLALLDIVGYCYKSPGFAVLLDECESKLFLPEPRPLWGEFEKYGVETELEFVLPLLDLLIRRTGIGK